MALTETRPETGVDLTGEPISLATLDGIIGSADHKTIGRAWIGTGLLVLIGATVLTAIAGFEATSLVDFSVVADAEEFTQVWSLGQQLLLLGGLVPILIGLATYLVPLQIGAPAIAFPRGAAGAFWTWLLGVGLLVASYMLNGGPGGGQTDFVVLWAVALGMMVAALCWAMTVIATTILGARTQGMTLDRVPHTTWSFLVFCLIGLLSLPLVILELVVVYVQVRHGFLPLGARDSLTGVLSGLSLAPGLYWVGIPLLGMAVDMIGVHTGSPVRAHKPVMVAVGLFGILAYGMAYFAMGSLRTFDFNHELLAVTIAAAVLPILAVLGLAGKSLRGGKLSINPALVGSLVAGLLLLLAAAVSVLGLAEPAALFLADDLNTNINLNKVLVLNGTTFHDGVRGLVVGASVVVIIAALHHWSTKIWGRRAAQPLGFLAILSAAGGAVLWAIGAVLAGIDDQAAYPVSTIVGGENVETFNTLAWLGMVGLLGGVVVGALSVVGAALGSGKVGGDRWTGSTLEWLASSPPSPGNFASSPVVSSAFPMEDMAAAAAVADETADTASADTASDDNASDAEEA